MSFPVSVPCTFANQSGEIPLSELDANFAAVVNAINNVSTPKIDVEGN